MMLFGLKNKPVIFSRIIVVGFKEFIQIFLAVYMDEWTMYGLVKDHLENM